MRVLVAIPVFNEARYVRRVLEEVRRCISRGCSPEATLIEGPVPHILVVDDGSTDGTAEILEGHSDIHVLRHPENRGYGASLIDAFRYAHCRGYDWIITLDCDDQHEPARIPEFIRRAAMDDVDIVSGSRYLTKQPADTSAPEDRQRINRIITRLLNRELGLSLTDSFCGFKAYRVEAVGRLPLTVVGYAFPLQFWAQVVRYGLRVCELPVTLIYNDPNRYFGGMLDDPASRLAHYLEVFRDELEREPDEVCSGCCEEADE